MPAPIRSGPYLFYTTTTYSPGPEGTATGQVGTLIDQRNHSQVKLLPPGCSYFADAMFGGPWLLVPCTGNTGLIDLYNVTRGTWRAVRTGCTSSENAECDVVAVGRYWLRLETSCYHCADRFTEENINTGKVRKDPEVVGGTRIADLDLPSLVAKLCRPLHVPASSAPTPDAETEPGFLTRYGSFGLASVLPPSTGAFFYLERCGSSLHRDVPEDEAPPLGDSDAIVWQAHDQVNGWLLPSLRRLIILTPENEQGVAALGGKTLYLGYPPDTSDSQGPLWEAQLRLP